MVKGLKRRKRHLWLSIILIVVIVIGVIFFRTQWAENFIAHKLIERTSAERDGFYNLRYKKLSLSIWNGELKLEGVRFKPDSTVFNEWQKKDSLPNTYIDFSIDMIHFKGLNLTWRHDFKKLHFKSFQIKTPDIKIYQTNDIARPQKKHHASSKNLYQMLSNYITDLSVNELNLDNASILFRAINPQSPIIYSMQNISFDAYGFVLNQDTYENGKLLFCDNFKFITNQPQQLITNNDFTLTTKKISLNTVDSLIYISDIELISNRKNPGYPENCIDASVKTVSIEGIMFERHEALNDLTIKSFNILSPEITTSHVPDLAKKKNKDKTDTYENDSTNILNSPLTIYDIVSPIFHRLAINEFDVDNAKLNYTLYTPKGTDDFKVDDFTFKAYDLVVDSVSTSNNRFLFNQNLDNDINKLSGKMRSSHQYVTINHLGFNSIKGDLLIDYIQRRPIVTSSNKSYSQGSINEVAIDGIAYKDGIEVESFIIRKPLITYSVATKENKNLKTDKQKKKFSIDQTQMISTVFNSMITHFSLRDFKIQNANVLVFDKDLKYQLKDFDVYATDLLLKDAPNQKDGYSFSYGKMGFSFQDFDNYLPGKGYRLKISNGAYSTKNNLLQFKNILLVPQDTLFEHSKSILRFESPLFTISNLEYKQAKQEKSIAFNNLSLESPNIELKEKSGNQYSIKLTNIGVDSLSWSKSAFQVRNIAFDSPYINAYTIAKAKEKKETVEHKSKGLPKVSVPDSLYHHLAKIADKITIGKLDIPNILVNYTTKEKDTIIHLKLDTTNICLNNMYADNMNHTLSLGQPYFSTINISYPLDKGLYNIAVKKIELNNTNLYLDNVSYTSPYSKMEFSYKDPKHKSWNHLTISQIGILGINYAELLDGNRIELNRMVVDNVELQNFANMKTRIPHHKWYPLLYSYLQKLPIAIDIPVIDVNNFTVIYQELAKKGTEPGTLSLNDMTGTITNVTNIVTEHNPYMIANMKGKLMDKADFDIIWEIPIDSLNDNFILKANVGEYDLTDMNRLIAPIVPIKIKSGNLKQMTLHAEASSQKAKADMLLQYDNLYAEIDHTKGDEVKESRFITKIANKILKHENIDHHAITEIKRDPYHPTFNYIWQIMEPALVESVGIPIKEQEKAIKTLSFFERIIHFFRPKKTIEDLKYPELLIPNSQ